MSHAGSDYSDESVSAEIYENVDYPLSFVLTGAGRVGAWNVPSVGTAGSRLKLANEATRHPMRFNFKRIAGGTGSLGDGDIVNVSVKTIEDVSRTLLQWEESAAIEDPLSSTTAARCSFIVFDTGLTGANKGYAFNFNVYEEDDSMFINLSPSPWPLPVDSPDVPATPAANLCLSMTSPSVFHSVVWAIDDPSTVSTRTRFLIARNVLAAGIWVWKRP